MALHDETALDGFTERDPAERSTFNRVFYRNRRPTWLGHWVSQFFCWWARFGLTPHAWVALHVRDRVSGRWRQDAVVVPSVRVGAPLTDFAAIASQYPVYRIELPAASSNSPRLVPPGQPWGGHQ